MSEDQKRTRRFKPPLGDRAVRMLSLLPVVVIAVALFIAALPRFLAAMEALPVEAAIDTHWNEQPLTQRQLRPLEHHARRAVTLSGDAKYLEQHGFLRWLAGRFGEPGSTVRRQTLWNARALMEESLTRAPVKPFTWLRLARIELLLGTDSDRFSRAMLMSMLTGRVSEAIVQDRLSLGIRHFTRLDNDARLLLVDQIRVAHDLDGEALADLLERRQRQLQRARLIAAREDPNLSSRLEETLATLD